MKYAKTKKRMRYWALRHPLLMAMVLVIGVSQAVGQITMELLPPERNNDDNFRIESCFGFSASLTQRGEYRIYGVPIHGTLRWFRDSHGWYTNPLFGTNACSNFVDPRFKDDRCLEVIGMFSKKIDCFGGDACGDNDRWHGHPGTNNVTVWADPNIWPRQDDFGSYGFEPIFTPQDMHGVRFEQGGRNCGDNQWCPPKSGYASSCFPTNPDEYATGVSNSKVVEHVYPDGRRRWFMAFNIQRREAKVESAADNWEVAWAWSDDGRSWKVYNRMLLRNVYKAGCNTSCANGFLVNNMLIDGDKFYLLFTPVHTYNTYMLRATIDPNPPSQQGNQPGYLDNWQLATLPATPNGDLIWKDVVSDDNMNTCSFAAMRAHNILPSPLPGNQRCAVVRQADIALVHLSDNPNSPSKYIAVASQSDSQNGCDGSEQLVVYSSTSLNKTFTPESTINTSSVSIGLFGSEFSFSHKPKGMRTYAHDIDLWIVQNLPNPNYPRDIFGATTATRRKARISGGIFPPHDNKAPHMYVDFPANNATVSGEVAVVGWAVDANRIAKKELFIDNRVVNASFVAVSRPAVCSHPINAGINDPDCPNVGWRTFFNTARYANGWHDLKVVVTDTRGNAQAQTKRILVNNPTNDQARPTAHIDFPLGDATVGGEVAVSGWAIDANSVVDIEMDIDGTLVAEEVANTWRSDVCNHPVNANINDPQCPRVGWSYIFDSRYYTNGQHDINVTFWDQAGNRTVLGRRINIDNNNSSRVAAGQSLQVTIAGKAVDGLELATTYAELRCDMGLGTDGQGAGLQYQVTVSPIGFGAWVAGKPMSFVGGRQASYDLTGLQPGTRYMVMARTKDQHGQWGSPISKGTFSVGGNAGQYQPLLGPVGQALAVYPNPTTGRLAIKAFGNNELPIRITLTGQQGRIVQQVVGDIAIGHELNLNDVKAGTYILSCYFADGRITKTKVVKE